MSEFYPDLIHTNFPNSIDSWEDSVDVDQSTLPLVIQYQQYLDTQNVEAAHQMLVDNPELIKIIVNADLLNTIKHGLMAVQQTFKNDVEAYLSSENAMPKSVYDPQGKETDVFGYIDNVFPKSKPDFVADNHQVNISLASTGGWTSNGDGTFNYVPEDPVNRTPLAYSAALDYGKTYMIHVVISSGNTSSITATQDPVSPSLGENRLVSNITESTVLTYTNTSEQDFYYLRCEQGSSEVTGFAISSVEEVATGETLSLNRLPLYSNGEEIHIGKNNSATSISETTIKASSFVGNLNGNAATATNANYSNAAGTAVDQTARNAAATAQGTANNAVPQSWFSWSNPDNAPTYLWGTNSAGENFLVNRSGMAVNYANSAHSATHATHLGGIAAGSFARVDVANNFLSPITLSNYTMVHAEDTTDGWQILLRTDNRVKVVGFTDGGKWKSISAKSFDPSSSRRFKENIRPEADDVKEKLMQLVPVIYDFKDGITDNQHGFIAEDVEAVMPEMVTHDEEGRVEGLRYMGLIGPMLKVLQQQESRIAHLEAALANQSAEERTNG